MHLSRLYREQSDGTLDKYLAKQSEQQLWLVVRDLEHEVACAIARIEQRTEAGIEVPKCMRKHIKSRNDMLEKVRKFLP